MTEHSIILYLLSSILWYLKYYFCVFCRHLVSLFDGRIHSLEQSLLAQGSNPSSVGGARCDSAHPKGRKGRTRRHGNPLHEDCGTGRGKQLDFSDVSLPSLGDSTNTLDFMSYSDGKHVLVNCLYIHVEFYFTSCNTFLCRRTVQQPSTGGQWFSTQSRQHIMNSTLS